LLLKAVKRIIEEVLISTEASRVLRPQPLSSWCRERERERVSSRGNCVSRGHKRIEELMEEPC